MQALTLTAAMRSKTDKLGSLRSNGQVPAVVYGARVENTSISVPSAQFEKILKIVGESGTVVLELGDTGKKIDVLIHDVQVDPVKSYPIHIDFLAIDMNKPIEVHVPIEFIGLAQAEKDSLGVLVKVLHEFEIKALPKDLPHNIEVDITNLANLGDQIHAKDIKLPSGVELKTDADEVVALIAAVREEKVEEEAPVDLSTIEVEKKGKKEEGEVTETSEEEKAE